MKRNNTVKERVVMRRRIMLLLGFVLFLTGCSNEISVEDEISAHQVKEVLETNITALNDKDIDSYLSTIMESARERTKSEMTELFNDFDIKFELSESYIVEEESDKYVIQSTQLATAYDRSEESEYRDHTSTNLHTLERIDGKWLITESEILDIEFHD